MDVAHQLLPGELSRHNELGVRHEPGRSALSGDADLLPLQEPGPVPEGHGHRARGHAVELCADYADHHHDVHQHRVSAVVQAEQAINRSELRV